MIIKYYPNSFHETELDSYLKEKGIKKVIVCGMMTHMCVDTTVRAAMDYGYEVDLVADGCATMDLEISGEIIPAEIVQKAFWLLWRVFLQKLYSIKRSVERNLWMRME